MSSRLTAVRSTVTGTRAAQLAYRCAVTGRLTAERWVLSARTPDATAVRGRILAYHSVGTPSWGVNDVAPRRFEEQLQLAADDGWTFATPAQVRERPADKLLAITFDDGVRSVLQHAVPVLRHHGVPATVFVVTGWADGGHDEGHAHVMDWRELVVLRGHGVELASHSATHPDFGRLGEGAARAELETSRERMREVLGEDVTEFAIPFGQSRNWTAAAGAAAAAAGYATVYAQAESTRPGGTVPRTFVTRLDRPRLFRAALAGSYDSWEEWY